jgi:hypothetical protein
MFTFRGLTRTQCVSGDRCQAHIYATGGFAFNSGHSYPRIRVSIPQDETARVQRANRVNDSPSLPHSWTCFCLARGRPDTTTSIQVMTSSIILLSSWVSTPIRLSASLRGALGTARSRRFGSALVMARPETAEACVQEATIVR